MADERAKRLVVRQRARAAIEPLRRLLRSLAEWERLEDADAFGVVRIEPGASETGYAADVLDMVGTAVREAGEDRAVEVFVISSPIEQLPPSTQRVIARSAERRAVEV